MEATLRPDLVFKALGDPVRLEMVRRLSDGASVTIGALASGFGITRQGVRKHLQVLADALLVSLRPQGRETMVRLQPEVLAFAKAHILELEARWDVRLAALKAFVESD